MGVYFLVRLTSCWSGTLGFTIALQSEDDLS